MRHLPARVAVLLATAVSAVAMGGAPAQAAACDDAVARSIHTVHDRVGDPAGTGHAAESTYCNAKP